MGQHRKIQRPQFRHSGHGEQLPGRWHEYQPAEGLFVAAYHEVMLIDPDQQARP